MSEDFLIGLLLGLILLLYCELAHRYLELKTKVERLHKIIGELLGEEIIDE